MGRPKLYKESTRSLSMQVPKSHYDRLMSVLCAELDLLKKRVVKESIYNCGKCGDGEFSVKHTIDDGLEEIVIKKCASCKYQYGVKELYSEKLKPIIN